MHEWNGFKIYNQVSSVLELSKETMITYPVLVIQLEDNKTMNIQVKGDSQETSNTITTQPGCG